MDLRNLSHGMNAQERVDERRTRIEKELGISLSHLAIGSKEIGSAEEKNCEQMFGAVPIPIGLAGPLRIHFSSGEMHDMYVPLATTEGALVASVNRGCKAVTRSGGVRVSSEYVGITRSIAFEVRDVKKVSEDISSLEKDWKEIAEATSEHLKILSYEINTREQENVLFLTLSADTDEAMGMNMITIAAQAVADFISKELDIPILTVAGNLDSDKKPSKRTKSRGRGYRIRVEATIPDAIIKNVLKSVPDALLRTARAKLTIGSQLAGAIAANLHAANMVAALYLATGQDVAHTVEGSLTDTKVHRRPDGVRIRVKLSAILVGVRGGGTNLPAQKQCLNLLLQAKTKLRKSAQLAEIVGSVVLAGELSLLAAQASNTLAKAHRTLSR